MCSWKVPAGFASPAADHTEKRIDLNDHLIKNKYATHLFRVKGDSMIDAGIFPESGYKDWLTASAKLAKQMMTWSHMPVSCAE